MEYLAIIDDYIVNCLDSFDNITRNSYLCRSFLLFPIH